MTTTSVIYPKKVHRLAPTLDDLRQIGECIISIPLIPFITGQVLVDTVIDVCHSRQPLSACFLEPATTFVITSIMTIGGLVLAPCALARDLILGQTY